MSENEPFGRQPQPVKVILEGDPIDVAYYCSRLASIIDNSSYDSVVTGKDYFMIYPRAVND